ncbi:hypothetical protein G6011_11321 [Alternaria panax]|uniref:Aminotransferase class I/classII large domain-containing protein n=1 Tax=Alternaria panax TaxID=48097 RepID=A0AAD4IDI2_9PLEO|nr:hypothetical protein G6011_11321 [Alternaria panax]
MATFVNKRFSPVSAVTMDQVSFVSGVTALNDILSLCMTDGDNEGLLLGMPIYGSFNPDMATMSNCKLVYTPFDGTDQFTTAAVGHYERAVGEADRNGIHVKALVISNPHNPLGRCYPRSALEAILRFCGKHGIHLISDEIYAQPVYSMSSACPEFTSVLSLDATGIIDPGLVHVMYGVSKDFAAAGLRLGCLITRNEELGQAVQSLARFHGASPVTDAIATTMLEDEKWHTQFLSENARVLSENQKLVARALDNAGIPYDHNA